MGFLPRDPQQIDGPLDVNQSRVQRQQHGRPDAAAQRSTASHSGRSPDATKGRIATTPAARHCNSIFSLPAMLAEKSAPSPSR